jgi:hypothetical protein
MVEWMERLFPGLHGTLYTVTSPPTDEYNCVAWAADVTNDWWWPIAHQGRRIYWPPGVASEETITALRDAFATLGYILCADERLEAGLEKIALFVDAQGLPTHAARQLSNGRWTSKLGQGDDIEHELLALEGEIYGTVALVMKRPAQASVSPPHP